MKKIIVSALALIGLCFSLSQVLAYDTSSPELKIYNANTLRLNKGFFAYDKNFKGGASVAFAKLDDSNNNFIITGAGYGGGPQVKIFDKFGNEKYSFMAFSSNFKGGVNVSAGDVNKDGYDEIICSQASSGQAWIKVYDKTGKKVISNFLAFSSGFKGGANVASGDINGDKKDEIIVGAGYGGGPQVRVFNKKGNPIFSSYPFAFDYKGGVNVASGDVDNDLKDEIIASQASEGQAWVKVFKANKDVTVLGNFLAYDSKFKGGATVSAIDVNNDKKAEVITGAGFGGGPQVKVFTASGNSLGKDFFAFDQNYKGGINVASGKLTNTGKNKILASVASYKGERGNYPYQKYIEVDISEQWLKYFQDGRKIGYSLASTGNYGTDTPLGTFFIFSKRLSVRMSGPGYDLPGVPYVLSFLGPYTIHGTYWHSNFGHRMSHGCVNLPTPFAAQVYNWADIGTPVVIHS
ncbi:MAG: L,D-transpeptidase family protein [Patescibacteria group bacterium]|jgi:lipoprotein-anchoring transpeptidase ErfK/SrfK